MITAHKQHVKKATKSESRGGRQRGGLSRGKTGKLDAETQCTDTWVPTLLSPAEKSMWPC